MTSARVRRCLLALLAAALLPSAGVAQGVKIAVGDVGLGIGDVPRLDGLRLNFRDRHLERVRGVNVTLWEPYEGARGEVQGLAVGLPLTGARTVEGLAVGAAVAVEDRFTGIGLAPLGFGAGERVRGIALAGLGIGGGGDLEGVMVGGIGLGVGGDIRGVAIGGVGAGGGGDLTGLGVGGVGLGMGGDLTGVAIGGIGVGAGGRVRGLAVGGVGVGVGGGATGVTVGGVGVGSGGELRGLTLAGVGVGAPRLTGLTVSGIGAGAEEARGVVVAPAFFRIEEGGSLSGVSISAFNDIQGRQRGLTIGLLNITEELHGVQVGLLNIAWNKPSWRVLPLVNYHR
ncbi:MAG: hypothetical protein KY453_05835 [Gemmatimonadetes bacterium]|nr:hypothetical protein [Gemmatimonadota bacterium]